MPSQIVLTSAETRNPQLKIVNDKKTILAGSTQENKSLAWLMSEILVNNRHSKVCIFTRAGLLFCVN